MAGVIIRNLSKSSIWFIERNSVTYNLAERLSNWNYVLTQSSINSNQQNLISITSKRNLSMDFTKYRSYTKYDTPKKEEDYSSDSESESDGDRGRGKERGTSEFWRRKMRTLHGLLDVNKDGVISYDDFKLLANKFESLGHLTKEENEEFQSIIQETWERNWGEISPYNLVTVEQYLTDMHHSLNDKALSKKIHLFLPYIFKAVDKDNSGCISLTEFKLFFKCLGLTEEDAAVSFAVIDKNGDGRLSIKEFVKLGRDYFFREDEKHISKMFWGPLVH